MLPIVVSESGGEGVLSSHVASGRKEKIWRCHARSGGGGRAKRKAKRSERNRRTHDVAVLISFMVSIASFATPACGSALLVTMSSKCPSARHTPPTARLLLLISFCSFFVSLFDLLLLNGLWLLVRPHGRCGDLSLCVRLESRSAFSPFNLSITEVLSAQPARNALTHTHAHAADHATLVECADLVRDDGVPVLKPASGQTAVIPLDF